MTNVDFSPKPYRIEWRLGRTPWALAAESDSHDDARRLAREHVEKFGGFSRVVVQHVIERFDAGMQKRRRSAAKTPVPL